MKKILITGGAGFIGTNAALYFSKKGWQVAILDNLSRKGTEFNLNWLREQAQIDFHKADVRERSLIERIVNNIQPDVILHLASQVAVTTSIINPREDFEINALGTFNLLEAVRNFSRNTFFINASTNKVYGQMEEVGIITRNGRYEYEHLVEGVDEGRNLDFHSPYGCSKGTADQYTLDYARIYGIRSTTFRQSCIYGPHQFGMEDQGWVAWFIIASCLGKQITLFGDGKQTRDILDVEDLIGAYQAAIDHQEVASGQAFNIGGGPTNMMSLLELLAILEEMKGKKIPLAFDHWRSGDQRVFVCNIAKAKKLLNWSPKITAQDGVRRLADWVYKNKGLFSRHFSSL